MTRLLASIATLAIGIMISLAGPTRAENVLRWASAGGVLTFEPHSLDETANSIHFRQVYEPLVDLDSDLKLVPMLAVEWQVIDPQTWEFRLRDGVSFHDGTPLTADDVVFSLRRAQSDTSDWKNTISTIAAVEALDAHTVRIKTSVPDMILPTALRNIMIMPKMWAKAHGADLPADFDAGEQTLVTIQANGTGPFQLHEFTPPDHAVLARNPDWWGLERYPHNIDRIVCRAIDDAKARLDALLTAEIDFLPDPPLDALDTIRSTAELRLAEAPQLR
ncbi:MAG TPA: ABC transporter substrate-binding protein, partial [Woeseiaceae bacterium]